MAELFNRKPVESPPTYYHFTDNTRLYLTHALVENPNHHENLFKKGEKVLELGIQTYEITQKRRAVVIVQTIREISKQAKAYKAMGYKGMYLDTKNPDLLEFIKKTAEKQGAECRVGHTPKNHEKAIKKTEKEVLSRNTAGMELYPKGHFTLPLRRLSIRFPKEWF